MEDLIIGEMEPKYTECGSKEYVKNGKDKCKSGEKQGYPCKKCKHRFGGNPGFEHRRMAPVFITPALALNGMWVSPSQIVLKHMNVDVRVDTVSRWLEHYVTLVEKYTNPIFEYLFWIGMFPNIKRWCHRTRHAQQKEGGRAIQFGRVCKVERS